MSKGHDCQLTACVDSRLCDLYFAFFQIRENLPEFRVQRVLARAKIDGAHRYAFTNCLDVIPREFINSVRISVIMRASQVTRIGETDSNREEHGSSFLSRNPEIGCLEFLGKTQPDCRTRRDTSRHGSAATICFVT